MIERYDSNFFVGRIAIVERINDWANDPKPRCRVLSVVGPPGTGKSWLMAKIDEQLNKSGQKRLVLEANLSKDPSSRIRTGKVKFELNTDRGLQIWVKDSLEQAKKICSNVTTHFDAARGVESAMDRLAEELCGMPCQPLPAPILIVDGFEEAESDERRMWLEEHIFGRFLSRGCTRLIIARRDDYTLSNNFLRWNEKKEWLDVLEGSEGKAQLEKRATGTHHPDINSLLNSIPPYKWNHPRINSDLFQRADANRATGKLPLLGVDDLRACIDILVQPSTPIKSDEFKLLVRLTDLDEFWTDYDLMQRIGIKQQDPTLRRLFELGIVLPPPPSSTAPLSARQVAGGIRELVLAWKDLNQRKI